MIKAGSLDALELMLGKASEKAQKKKPSVEILEAGHYRVEGSNDRWYDVRCGRTEDGEFFIACLCRGSLESKACYHAASAFYRHKSIKQTEILLRESEKRKDSDAPYLHPNLNKKREKLGDISF